jgi:hypothetical protein
MVYEIFTSGILEKSFATPGTITYTVTVIASGPGGVSTTTTRSI